MGVIQKQAFQSSIVSYVGMGLGYINRVFLFISLLTLEQIGLVNLLVNISVLFAQLSSVGTSNSILKFAPILRRSKKDYNGFLSFKFKMVIIGSAVVSGLIFIFNKQISEYYKEASPGFSDYFIWIIPCGLAILAFRLLEGHLTSLMKTVFSAFVNEIVLRLMATGLLLTLWYDLISFPTFVKIFCLSYWTPVILLIIYLKSIGEWTVSSKRNVIRPKLKRIMIEYSLITYLNSIGNTIIASIDSIMIAGILGLKETAIYTTVMHLTRPLSIPYRSIMRISVPLVPIHFKNTELGKLHKLYKNVASISLTIGFFMFLGVWVNRFDLFDLLPPEFEEGIYVFLFLMIGRLVDMYFGLNGTILIMSKKYKYDMVFTGILVILMIVFNILFIEKYGVVGAAISTGMVIALSNIFRMLFVKKSLGLTPFSFSNLPIIILALSVFAFFQYFRIESGNLFLNILINTTVLVILFPGLIYLFKLETQFVSYINTFLEIIGKKITKR